MATAMGSGLLPSLCPPHTHARPTGLFAAPPAGGSPVPVPVPSGLSLGLGQRDRRLIAWEGVRPH